MEKLLIAGILLSLVLLSGCNNDIGSEKKEISIEFNSTDITMDFKCEYESWSEQNNCIDLLDERKSNWNS